MGSHRMLASYEEATLDARVCNLSRLKLQALNAEIRLMQAKISDDHIRRKFIAAVECIDDAADELSEADEEANTTLDMQGPAR